jgi:hypothetical protein
MPQSPQPLADGFVDEQAARRVDHLAALAAAALFGGAGLVVDDGRNAGAFAHVALDGIELVAMPHRNAVRQVRVAVGTGCAVGDDHDVAHAFGMQLVRDLRHRQIAVMGLAAGHGNRVVVEDLVGGVDA